MKGSGACPSLPSPLPLTCLRCYATWHAPVPNTGFCPRSPAALQSAELSLSFGCRLPNGQGEVTLEGAHAFGAAAFLASLSAGERMQRVAGQPAAPQQAQRDGPSSQQATAPAQPATSRWHRLF